MALLFWNIVWQFLTKLSKHMSLPFDLAIILRDNLSKGVENLHPHRNLHTNVTGALFIIAPKLEAVIFLCPS